MRTRLFHLSAILYFSCCLAQSVSAQLELKTLQDFQESYPLARTIEAPSGATQSIYGTVLSNGATPLESAQNHVNQWESIFGKDIGILVPQVNPNGVIEQGVMFNQALGTYKFSAFRFNQFYNGIPVFRSGIGFLVRNQANYPLVFTGFDVKDMTGFENVANQAGLPVITPAMIENVSALMDADSTFGETSPDPDPAPFPDAQNRPSVLDNPTTSPGVSSSLQDTVVNRVKQLIQVATLEVETKDAQTVIWAGINNEFHEPTLAVTFIATRGSTQTIPNYSSFLIVASVETGEILLAENQIHNVDVFGNLQGRATDGFGSLECHPETAQPLPYAEVEITGGGSTYSDVNGDYLIPHGGASPVSVISRLSGQYFEVRDRNAGNTIPSLTQSVTPPGPGDFLHNPTDGSEFSAANVNAYVEANVVRDYVLSYIPSFPVIAGQTSFLINTNFSSNCNAFYDGSSINFYTSGGGCNNTSFSDVVYHEYGHHLVNVSGNGQGQFGEGAGDCVGVLLQDDPILGHGFRQDCSAGIRNADNSHQYPCSEGIHDCGQLISGCVWDLRNQLVVTEPSNYRDIGASLFLGMMIVRGQTQPGNSFIDPSITVIYLELDDDDGEIGNGTPHYDEIAAAFALHNMDAPPLELLKIVPPTEIPEFISACGETAFQVTVLNLTATHESNTANLHLDRGNGFEVFPMTLVSGTTYDAVFPDSPCATQLKYYFSAQTTEGATALEPVEAPADFYTSISGDSAEITFSDNFQGDLGWTTDHDVIDGHWERDYPIGEGARGDPPEDADGSGRCYLTANDIGNSDVDDGTTIVISPIVSAIPNPGQHAMVRYYRWYSNSTGANPEADIFVVEVSNDGGTTWVDLEIVGPSGPEVRGGWIRRAFKISDFVTPTDQMRFRFSASDLDSGSIVEAGLDGFEIIMINCAEVVPIETLSFTTGELESGSLADLDDSDNIYLQSKSTTDIAATVIAEITGESITETPNVFSFTIESHSGRTRLQLDQIIEFYDYAAAQWEVVDRQAASITQDSTVVIEPTGDLSRYVEPGTRTVKARLSYRRVRGRTRQRVNVYWDEIYWKTGN